MTFDQWVAGRTVALVGPAPPVGDQTAEIDGHDLVVRFHRFADSPPIPEGTGTRTDAAYFNGLYGRDLDAGRPPADLAWVCLKSEQPLLAPNWRHARRVKLHQPNLVPLAAHDLLAAHPDRVTVYCADFYLGPDPYADPLEAHASAETAKAFGANPSVRDVMGITLSIHDQTKQRRFLRLLIGVYPQLTGDERFLRNLAMDDRMFAAALRRQWGDR